MADGDLIYVPTASDGIGYKLGGSALAYKATAPAPQYGYTVSWTAGDIYYIGQNLSLNPAGGGPLFSSAEVLDTAYGAAPPSDFGWYENPLPPGKPTAGFWRIEGVWKNSTPTVATLRFLGEITEDAVYTLSGVTRPTYPGTGIAIGTYTRASGLDLGTVTVTA